MGSSNSDVLEWIDLQRAIQNRQRLSAPPWNPLAGCFLEQGRAAADPSRFQAWICGRRAGKTEGACRVMFGAALSLDDCQVFYISTTKLRAAATVWDSLVDINRRGGLGGRPNYGNHVIRLPNASKVVVTGCENKKMADDLRGRRHPRLYVIDEGQDWPDDLLRYLFDKVILPSLADVRGSVLLMGTGGSPRGFYYEAQSDSAAWSAHRWTPFVNPHLAEGEARSLIDKAMRDRGVTEDDPSIQREFYGRFVADLTRQVFPVGEINLYDGDLPQGRLNYVIGGDVGAVDATAAVVWAWAPVGRKLYEVHSEAMTGLPVTGQVAMFERLIREYSQRGPLLAVCIDPGGGGKGLILELQQRFNLPIIGAERTEKPAAAVTMRGDLANGTIQLRRGFKLREALQVPEWDPDNVGTALKGHWPDIADAAIYGYRHCYQYLSPLPEPPKTVDEKMDEQTREYLEQRRRLHETDDYLA